MRHPQHQDRQRQRPKSGDEPGLWRRSAPAGHDGPAELAWHPAQPLWRRALRGIGVPAVLGIAVFVVPLVITAVIMLRGMNGSGSQGERDLVSETAERGTGAGTADDRSATHATGDAGNPAEGEGTSGGPGTAEGSALLVHVVGEVGAPGVVELPPGSRVLDALTAAGGATDAAVLAGVNLARPVADGEQILVPNAADVEAGNTGAAGGAAAGAGTGSGSGVGAVSLNQSSAAELERLTGVGPALAARIIEWREQHGGFTSIEQLLEVSGIGQKTLERLRSEVTL